jgi:hypothetical protein
MSLLIPALVLMIALFTGVFIAPQTCNRLGLRIDPCVLETNDLSMIDPDCSRMLIETAFAAIGRNRTATATRLPAPQPDDAIPR